MQVGQIASQMRALTRPTHGMRVALSSIRMTGVIRTRHLFTHCVTIIRGFGLKAYLACVWRVVRHPGRKSTFLGTIY